MLFLKTLGRPRRLPLTPFSLTSSASRRHRAWRCSSPRGSGTLKLLCLFHSTRHPNSPLLSAACPRASLGHPSSSKPQSFQAFMRFQVPHYNVEGCVAKRQDRITIDQLPMVGVGIFSDSRNKCRDAIQSPICSSASWDIVCKCSNTGRWTSGSTSPELSGLQGFSEACMD